MNRILRFLYGYLLLELKGGAKERFLNLCASRGIYVWNVKKREENLWLYVTLADFFNLRPLVRKTKAKVVIRQRHGLPFFMPKLRKKWFFLFCTAMTFSVLVMASTRLWSIDCVGNHGVTDDQLEEFLESRGLKRGVAMSRIHESELEKELRKAFSDLSWVSVTLKGSRMTISVKETLKPAGKTQDIKTPGDLVSPFDGVVVDVIVRNGVPKVKAGDAVVNGQILIAGSVPIYGDDGLVKQWTYVEADGDVIIERTCLYEDALPSRYVVNETTGRRGSGYAVTIGNRNIKLQLQKDFLNEYVTERDITPSFFAFLSIPVQLREIDRIEYLPTLRFYDDKEARKLIEKKIMRFLATLEEKGVQIIEKNVKIDNEGVFWLIHGEILVWEKAMLFQKLEEGADKAVN